MTALFSLILTVFFVQFTDKSGSQPISFSAQAIANRQQWHIPTDSLDYAVCTRYVDSIQSLGAQVFYTSRWMNGATISCNDSIAKQIEQFPFVRFVEPTRQATSASSPSPTLSFPHKQKYRLSSQRKILSDTANSISLPTDAQLHLLSLPSVHDLGGLGQGIVLAIIDGGFQSFPAPSPATPNQLNQANDLAVQNHINTPDNQAPTLTPYFDLSHWLGTYDFTDDIDSVYGPTGQHGTMCLALIAAQSDTYTGAAPEADYYLMRSEEFVTESPKEMDNLVVALERADSLGVHIASISLGYSLFDNSDWDKTYADMDGRHTRASLSATIAARKGMLVCVAAGNEGDKPWHYLTAPSDADSILCVGACDAYGQLASFSSRGPSSDLRIKPDLTAMGYNTCLLSPADGTICYGNGTSFACPLVAGMAASLWSLLPTENAQSIRRRLLLSASLYHSPDSDYGYGIPNAYLAYLGQSQPQSLPSAAEDYPKAKPQKIFLHGRLYIASEHHLFTLMGQKIQTFP